MQSILMESNIEHMITKASLHHADVLSELGAKTFYQSHKDSAPEQELARYMKKVYSLDGITDALHDPINIYHIIEFEQTVAGFSKIELDIKHPLITLPRVTKMDQIYLDESFHGHGLGAKLLRFNIEYSKMHDENGMWLVVWAYNNTAIRFYEKFGFRIIANDKFQLTDRHQSPCFTMLLDYANYK